MEKKQSKKHIRKNKYAPLTRTIKLTGFPLRGKDCHGNGLTIIRSAQCPYSVKNVDAILKTAKKLKIKANLIELKDSESAQHTPCAFGTFCIIHNNEVISHHPISNTRFENIMAKR
jgi:hypothetical protein